MAKSKNCVCILCGKKYKYTRTGRPTYEYCKSCMANRHRFALKAAAVEYLGGKCVLCGYSKSLRALTCDHVFSTEKDFGIAVSFKASAARYKAELDKCVLLCENCHREAHDDLEMMQYRPGWQSPLLKRIVSKHSKQKPRDFQFDRKDWASWHPKTQSPKTRR